ncbi:molybdenum import ATP-binding protein ModC [Bacterioplanes sanyensis]|uniref:molybdenum ABC transporter ATP-binding protein n=1 Tax=Bacterioplanes sanyensis TaxID=1249553 RepID=UPI001677E188|nr:molybdenum ABC transporter ATP-binding protein [Bacterioplanes sanyensis]GGY37109.1 molybdenum import ATP-binding protein ModC [Bacterioplanes sanyensis]
MSQLEFDLQLSRPGFHLSAQAGIDGGGITALFGPSGSGKTTLLRCLAGLEPAQGTITVNGQPWLSPQQQRPPHQRRLGYVFQEASLLPHLSVQGNLDYARKRAPQPLTNDELSALLPVLQVEHLLDKHAAQLSGGERQRIALLRALLTRPQLLLLDEPLAALDNRRRQAILPMLERLPELFTGPVLYVSHSVDEVTRLAQQVILIDEGQSQPPQPLTQAFGHHQTLLPFEQSLDQPLGTAVRATVSQISDDGLAQITGDGFSLWMEQQEAQPGQRLQLRLLARDISLSLQPLSDSSLLNQLAATIEHVRPYNASQQCLTLRLHHRDDSPAQAILALITQRSCQQLQLQPGKRVWAQIKASAVQRF